MVFGWQMTQRSNLINLIADLGFASEEQLGEAQPRQVIYGGDLELNLFELGLLSEDQLLEALSKYSDLPAAPVGYLHVDGGLTGRLREVGAPGVAGRSDSGIIRVFVGDALPHADVEAITDAVGPAFELMVTSRLRMDEALAYLEGSRLSVRETSLLDRFGARPLDPAPRSQGLSHPPPVEERHADAIAPPPASVPQQIDPLGPDSAFEQSPVRPLGASAGVLNGHPGPGAETGPPPEDYEELTTRASEFPPPLTSSTPARTYDRQQAIADLRAAKTRDRAIDVLVDYAAQFFDYTALFAILSKEARGLKAAGDGANTQAVRKLKIPLDLPSPFRTARESTVHRVTKLRASGLEGGIARDLDRPSGRDVFLLPLTVRGRAVLLLWGDRGKRGVGLEALGDLLSFAPVMSDTLERVLIERKRASRVAQPADMQRPPVVETRDAPGPPPQARLPEVPAGPTTTPAGQAPHQGSRKKNNQTKDRVPGMPAPKDGVPDARPAQTERNPAAPPAGARDYLSEAPPDARQATGKEATGKEPHEIAEQPKRTLKGSAAPRTDSESEPPMAFPAEAPRTLRGFPQPKDPRAAAPGFTPDKPKPAPRPEARPPLMSRRIVPIGSQTARSDSRPSDAPVEDHSERKHSSPPPPEAPPPPVTSEAPPPPVTSEAPPPPMIHHPNVSDDVPRMSAKGTLMSRRPPIAEPDEDGWGAPAVPVVASISPAPGRSGIKKGPTGRSYANLVDELLGGDRSALARLVDGGESAVGALIARFPGPVTEPETANSPASSCGPILEALQKLGQRSIPFLTVRTADEDPTVRRWATFLLGELPAKDSAKAIAGRLLDDALEVRRAALASARRVQSDMLARRTLRSQMESLCRDKKISADSRCAAIEALADIREHEAIPTLLQLLDDSDSTVVRATRWALSVLTRQDFGADGIAWKKFWQESRDQDRVEWLIQSLSHDQRDLRKAAGDELTAMAGKNFGFHEDLPEPQRRAAQAEFRSWWETVGKPAARNRI